MRKETKTPESNMMALPEICDFEKGGTGGKLYPGSLFGSVNNTLPFLIGGSCSEA